MPDNLLSQGEGDEWILEDRGGQTYLFCRPLLDLNWLCHGFSTRAALNLALHVGDKPSLVIERRHRFLEGLGLEPEALIAAEQVHGDLVRPVSQKERGAGAADYSSALRGTDGLVTRTAGLVLSVYTADCVPLLLIDPVQRAVAAVHAGWRGAVAGIPGRALEVMTAQYGCNPDHIMAAVGPSVGPCCYEVGRETADKVPADAREEVLSSRREEKSRLDLPGLVVWLLRRHRVRASRIFRFGQCTACRGDLFYSYRREGGRAGRMAAFLGRTD